ncbi:hypothetical protein GOODEAATRI_001126 [Goodea atripinnis]|uniref:Small ribosomal subunit protein uS7 n=1 Tax=Goodea atripinnis TaxID=208336 RepID=A0ABV0MNV9_9TELE
MEGLQFSRTRRRFSGAAGLLWPLLVACLWAAVVGYKPVIIVHGLFDSSEDFKTLKRFINEADSFVEESCPLCLTTTSTRSSLCLRLRLGSMEAQSTCKCLFNGSILPPSEWKENFLKIQKLVLIGGPDDGVITPWQSSKSFPASLVTEWETAPAVAESPEIKLFGKWSTDDVQINDISLQDYIAVKEKYAKYLPHSGGRYAAKRFRKAQCPIVERLTNSMMMHGRNNGKKLMTVRIVKHAFEIIHLLTGENPLQVLVNAIINSGPREDSTRIGRAGTVRRQAVDVSPLRRVNQAIWLLCTGAREAAFRNIKTIAECLADELINAAKGSSNSYAIKKKDELERVAKSNR